MKLFMSRAAISFVMVRSIMFVLVQVNVMLSLHVVNLVARAVGACACS